MFACHPDIEWKQCTKFDGKGLYATKLIKKGEVVWKDSNCWQTGIALSTNEVYKTLSFDEQKVFVNFSYQIGHDQYLGITTVEAAERDASNYWNHSCDANTKFVNDFLMVASRDIQLGEEVTMDYGIFTTVEWEGEIKKIAAPQQIKCLCGAAKCRGRVSKDDWKLPELREKYKGAFPSFIQEMIDAESS